MKRKGITLLELMIATAIVSIGVLGMIGAFNYLNRGIQTAKGKSLATNLAQEKMEVLKNETYFRIQVSVSTDTDANFEATYFFDVSPNGSENLNVGGIDYIRRVLIRKATEDPVTGQINHLNWNAPDTGLKEITVSVVWLENGYWKKTELRNLVNNPDRVNLGAVFSGNVTDNAAPTPHALSGVVVRAQENPARYAVTDAAGNYSLPIESGTYTLQASKSGYFEDYSPSYTIALTQTHDFSLVTMSSGAIYGSLLLGGGDSLMISGIVGSTVTATGDTEWVEVYNPTTWTWTMASGLGTGTEMVVIEYDDRNGSPPSLDFDYRTVALDPGHYYLFANTGTVSAAGVTRQADAVWNDNGNWIDQDNVIKAASPSVGGYVRLRDETSGRLLDKVGWRTSTTTWAYPLYWPEDYEGSPVYYYYPSWTYNVNGFQPGMGFTRRTAEWEMNPSSASCYDSGYNYMDFDISMPLTYGPRSTVDSQPCGTGKTAGGAIVFVDDGLSSPVAAYSDGYFYIYPVSTGTWTVYASSGLAFSSFSYYGGTSNWFGSDVGYKTISSTSVYGYISGRVYNTGGSGLPNIKMAAGVREGRTNSVGQYVLPVEPGEYIVNANYGTDDPNYIATYTSGINVTLGQMTGNVNFTLQQGGKISGWITTNGVDPLPNVPVSALQGGVEKGSGISDADGNFLIWGTGISAGTYEVRPQLDSGETSSPVSVSSTLAAGETLFVSTFTISGALGTLTGSVASGGSPISTGVLVIATTATITGSPLMPPTINSTTRAGSAVYYVASSNSMGQYTIPVRGGYTYNIYGWYTTWSGETPNIQVRQSTAAVAAGGTETENLSW